MANVAELAPVQLSGKAVPHAGVSLSPEAASQRTCGSYC